MLKDLFFIPLMIAIMVAGLVAAIGTLVLTTLSAIGNGLGGVIGGAMLTTAIGLTIDRRTQKGGWRQWALLGALYGAAYGSLGKGEWATAGTADFLRATLGGVGGGFLGWATITLWQLHGDRVESPLLKGVLFGIGVIVGGIMGILVGLSGFSWPGVVLP